MNRNWSEQQEAIFNWFSEPDQNRALVIRARAGTGKTTTVLEGANRAPEKSIIMCAFNKSVATELQQKISNPNAEAKTLHSLGFNIVRRYWSNVRVVNGSERVNSHAQKVAPNAPDEIVKQIAKLATKGKEMAPMAWRHEDLKDLAFEFDCVPDQEWEADGWDLKAVCEAAVKVMALAAEKDGMLDFADMLYVPIRNKWVRGRYDLVIVDEAQDMNASQIILAQKSVNAGGRICVVGDDRQAIYGFRGADSGSIDRLKSELKAVELGLTITYRCPKKVVALAAKYVPDYRAADAAPEGSLIGIQEPELVGLANPGDFVLSRKNAPLASICLAILKSGKRARIQGRDIGQGLIALVKRWKVNSMPVFLSRLANWEEKECKRTLAGSVSQERAEQKIEQIRDRADFIRAMAEGLSGVHELVARIETLFEDNGLPAVRCSSIHRAKGLEAEVVYVLQDSFNVRQWSGSQDPKLMASRGLEEENLRYVAYTRAKATLVLVHKPPVA